MFVYVSVYLFRTNVNIRGTFAVNFIKELVLKPGTREKVTPTFSVCWKSEA